MSPWLTLVIAVLGVLGTLAGVLLGARVTRGTNLHQMQVEHLCKLSRFLFEATENGRTLTSGIVWSTDATKQEIANSFVGSLRSAYSEFLDCRLLFPLAVETQVESFFHKMAEYRVQLGGLEHFPPGDQHAKAFTAAQQTAAKEIPALLKAIDASSRRIIGSG